VSSILSLQGRDILFIVDLACLQVSLELRQSLPYPPQQLPLDYRTLDADAPQGGSVEGEQLLPTDVLGR
jgi:hypothetical protein